ncbi:S8 family serine peptidase [Haloferax sp. MBLA0076]|uniref:S8 family serine peptidase n=1 Tax=Haloferax litoreum TaxID=2666140 RepID=A0A6A8GFS9_9EURY|nr:MULTISPECIES: S8 family serine peptidase [Haloferax]KAB1193493.1 S8 family serine peptidase [Haloferax sp. CBA1148]MRX22008.1 S8 family serine peptidase [Haloferax litoreum]
MTGNPTFNRRAFLKLSAAAGLTGMAGVTTATPGRSPGPKENEVLVGVSKAAGSPRRVVEEHLPGKARVVHENKTLGYVAVEFPDEASDEASENFISAITSRKHVKYAERNATHEALYTTNDPQYGSQYAPQQVNADVAWDTTLGSSNVTIAVVDQGVKYDHPDLSAQFGTDKGYDFVDTDDDPYPDVLADEYHGTHVAGIAAGTTDNDEGIGGISNSSLLSGRALSESGSGSTSDIADAIEWAADNGADVINLSLGGGGYTSTMKNAVSYATQQGSLVVAAAGNDGRRNVSYPAAYSECVAISALDPDGSLANYSNYGPEIDLAAPGTNVLSCWTTSTEYKEISGTSMATPVVSGVAGLALAQYDMSPADLRSHLKNTAVDIGLKDTEQGAGRVDAANAVETQPGGGGGSGGSSTTSTVDDSLTSSSDSDCWSYAWEYSSPSQVVVDLSGPSDADFDLYVDEGSGQCPTTNNYDYRSWSTDSTEQIVIDNPDTSTDLTVLVDSYSGSGSYTVTITETQ